MAVRNTYEPVETGMNRTYTFVIALCILFVITVALSLFHTVTSEMGTFTPTGAQRGILEGE